MTARVHIAELGRRHQEVAPEVEERVLAVLRSGQYVGGPVVQEAEALAARWFGREGAVGVGSGTDALMLALQAVGVGPGDEVIVPALTFFATAGAVCQLGAVPVVVDVREDGLIDPAAARAAWSPRTRAIVPVHLFGNRAEAPLLDVPVVDDAAQAIGAEPPASVGALTAGSVYPTKTWGAAGDGGFVVGEGTLLERVRALGNHGLAGPHLHEAIGGWVGRNSRLDAIQAAVLLGHAPRLAERVARRQAHARWYDAHLPPTVRPMPRDPGCPVPVYAVLVEDRPRVQAALDRANIDWQVHYPRPLQAQPALRHLRAHTPVAEHLCARLLALPVHEGLSTSDLERVAAALREACP